MLGTTQPASAHTSYLSSAADWPTAHRFRDDRAITLTDTRELLETNQLGRHSIGLLSIGYFQKVAAFPQRPNALPKLFAAEVMPHFPGQAQPTLDAAARASQARDDLAQSQLQTIEHMTKKYQDEVGST
ncbi:hypothetical protein MHAE_01770 [Mycobacterium haemophilum DSM 44634]